MYFIKYLINKDGTSLLPLKKKKKKKKKKNSFLELLFDRFSKKFFGTKSADVIVIPIGLKNNTISSPIIYIF